LKHKTSHTNSCVIQILQIAPYRDRCGEKSEQSLLHVEDSRRLINVLSLLPTARLYPQKRYKHIIKRDNTRLKKGVQ